MILDGPVPEAGVPEASWTPPGAPEPAEEPAAPSAKQPADDELFFLRMLKPFTRYQPDVSALRSGAPHVVIAVGEASHQEVAVRSARALADQLGVPPTTFPGDHGGFMADPAAFADAVASVLGHAG